MCLLRYAQVERVMLGRPHGGLVTMGAVYQVLGTASSNPGGLLRSLFQVYLISSLRNRQKPNSHISIFGLEP